jgi:hypothetical protein
MTLANEIVPVNAFEFELVIFLSFDKIIGFFFFLAVVLVFAYTLGKRAGRREVHGLMALTEPVETAEGEVQAPPTPRTRAMTDASRLGRFLSWWERAMTFGPTMWWSPAIEDYLTQSEIDRVLNGEEQAAQVLISAGDWNGISRQRRTELIQVLEDTLLRVSHTKLCAALCRPKLKPCELNWQLCELWKVNYNL